ncbi:uncharacterized protein LOC111717722 [Eurytemora carolleeae]|uniref:uncharacterized protein LOC111717722 n=1 Tax=Eurytemora carolleeae TaxID=1294199 RepID=UPI000C77FDCA|nr:uncharacterized protein LOC111717722 [Eurytemora carolleeae]|eukprot:XP_023348966.1 uncharacterized protein LOC111717722 [Eurytemora affinis]
MEKDRRRIGLCCSVVFSVSNMSQLENRLLLLLLLFVCQLNRFQARSLVVEDDVNSAADKLEGSRRDARYILIRRKPIPYNSDPIPYNSNFVYPPVNFLANGKPSKIVVNGMEYNGESEKKPTLAGNKEDDIVSVKPAAPSRPNSPITWISGRFPFNGLPSNIYIPSYFPAPPPLQQTYSSPITWIGSGFNQMGAAVGGLRSVLANSAMPAHIYVG